MNRKKAERIELLRTGPVMHSWRRISEIICQEFPDEDQSLKGNQLHGQNLCREAMCFLLGIEDIRAVPDSERERWDV